MEKNNKVIKGILWGILILLISLVGMYYANNFINNKANGNLPYMSGIKTDSTNSINIGGISVNHINIFKKEGIPALVKLNSKYESDLRLNMESSLSRDWIILNDTACPIQLSNSVGINTIYKDRSIRFIPMGSIKTLQPITAFEIVYVLYDVFGEHLLSLSNVEIADIESSKLLKNGDSWYATDNQVAEYYTCVSFVMKVRTKDGIIWNYDPLSISKELGKIEITYKKEYHLSNETENK